MPPKKRGTHPLNHPEVREQLHYNPMTGMMYWKISKPRVAKGMRAWYLHSSGYRHIAICGREYKEHRLVWFWVTGEWPAEDAQVDHANGLRDDNRWLNLRLSTQGQNQANTDRYGPMRGIHDRGNGKYRVRLNVAGVRTSRQFSSLSDAIQYRNSVFSEQWGEFACIQKL